MTRPFLPTYVKADRRLDPHRHAHKAAKALGLGAPCDRIWARQFTQPIVYAWLRGETCLYVGESEHGISRIFARHHTIKDLGSDDCVIIWDAPGDRRQRRRLESQLVDALSPTLNRGGIFPPIDDVEPAP